jgi:2,4-dienoyl-CoA reductase-like NADH-dependent reductase (Old Yellow Enzyme family)/thioredoxin reductase
MNIVSNANGALSRLLEPVAVGTLEVKNRMVMPPMRLCYASETGGVSERQIDYFVERAAGGVGLIIVGCVSVETKIGKLFVPSPMLYIGDNYLAGYRRLVEAIHEHGAKVAIQLFHPGRQASLENTGGRQPVSSSETETSLMGLVQMPRSRALMVEEIEELEDAFVAASLKAKVVGFDAVLIDGGAGHLIAQFMSPFVNKRTDEYGGDLEGRMRFPLRIIEKIRIELGEDYPILFDLPMDEYIEGGIRVEESRVMASMLERAGIRAFRLHGCLYETYQYIAPPAAISRGVHAEMGQQIKETLKEAKVMLGHRINDPVLAENILERQMADIILLGRPLIADPEFPKKVAEGRLEDINKCIACNTGCLSRIFLGRPATCTVNPSVGLEKEYRISIAKTRKNVLVVGGGVGGMEAARVAALRGHRVSLYEKTHELGGQALIAAVAPHKYEVKELIKYLKTQIKKADVDVQMEKRLGAEEVLRIKPEVVVLATGAVPVVPDIPGIGKVNAVTSWDVLLERCNVGKNVVIVGGGQVGLETAEFLGAKGKNITLLEMLPEVGRDMELLTKMFMLSRLSEIDVRILTKRKAEEISENGVRSGADFFEADTVVFSVGHQPVDSLFMSLKGRIEELYAIGDCLMPRKMIDAIHEGARAGRMIGAEVI